MSPPKGDGLTPVCQNCIRLQLSCKRPGPEFKFIIHTDNPSRRDVLETPPSPPTSEGSVAPSKAIPKSPEDGLGQATYLASLKPRLALQHSTIVRFFHHYVNVLAPWYDLNDSSRTFGTVVPIRALDTPILFKAIIAFSASHWSIEDLAPPLAQAFHTACVKDLLAVMRNPHESHGDYLAATCLLRSYEILNGDTRGNQRHLLGAYSFAVTGNIDLSTWGLLQAGVWNYLREEITVGLECRRPVRISTDFPDFQPDANVQDDMKANLITYILARIINFCFHGHHDSPLPIQKERIAEWEGLRMKLTLWTQNLPSSFEPISTACATENLFPSFWMLAPWHVSSLQYASIAEILLALYDPLYQESLEPSIRQVSLDFIQEHVLRVCGLAWTNKDVAARVNAFGPLSFCGRYLIHKDQQQFLEKMLLDFTVDTAWPVHCIISDLKECWARKEAAYD
ncbi:MAG: hypothetical protein M1834_006908 [Cirrosporium novae-zelandiae]|nr:MAG: hypothetical protein M1834_006908 [Cirrosporium novae-zelandiae]